MSPGANSGILGTSRPTSGDIGGHNKAAPAGETSTDQGLEIAYTGGNIVNASSPIAAPSTPEEAYCPEWCHYDEHDNAPGFHGSEPRGLFQFWQTEGGPISATLVGIDDSTDLEAARLRLLAAEALAAAVWIEAQQ